MPGYASPSPSRRGYDLGLHGFLNLPIYLQGNQLIDRPKMVPA